MMDLHIFAKADALFYETFGKAETRRFCSHGRLELLGNHTDHNHGLCLVGGVDMGIAATVAPVEDGTVKIHSEGFPLFAFSLDDLVRKEAEEGTSLALTKGILAKMKELGYKIGGFVAAMSNDIVPGAGVSSSACYESLIVKIVDALYNGDIVPPLAMAQIGQYAENVYFGKPSGLLDQIGTSFGGSCYLDFHDIDAPIVEPLNFDLPLEAVLIFTPSSHANLTPLYAEIPADMKKVAKVMFNEDYLGDVDPETFRQHIVCPIMSLTERQKLRAQHFFDENERVSMARKAIKERDASSFLEAVRLSGMSSSSFLANTMAPCCYEGSPQQALDYASQALGHGAVRIMGGGFAGSIIAFLPHDEAGAFKAHMAKAYGEKNVRPVVLLKGGPKEIGR